MRASSKKSACELGPIRPPSEASSLLIRVTRNCPWNRCLFCPVFKDRKFEKRSEASVLREIDLLGDAAETLRQSLGLDETERNISESVFLEVSSDPARTYEERRVALWMLRGGQHVFLQDADSLIRPAHRTETILAHLKKRLPMVDRVTTYARSRTLFAKSPADLARLKAAGLTRIHVGVESGSDEVLSLVEKGCRAEHHIAGIGKAAAAGFEICCYVMPGLGGAALSDAHVAGTAAVLRAVEPRHIRLRTMFLTEGIPLFEKVTRGELVLLEEDEVGREIRSLVRALSGIDSDIVSDHDHNLLTDVRGHLTRDAAALDARLSRFLSLPEETRDAFIVARRSGRLRSLDAFLSHPTVVAEMIPEAASLKAAGNGSLLHGMLTFFTPRLF